MKDSAPLLITLGVLAILAASVWIWAETAEIKREWTQEDSEDFADTLDGFWIALPVIALVAGIRFWPRTRTPTLILLAGIASTGLGVWRIYS